MSKQAFDPVTLEVMWNRLLAIVEEQARTLMRTAFSGVLTDAGDLSAGVFDRQANMVAQAVTGTPGHINTMARGVRRFLEHYPLDSLKPGDVLIGNHPYEISGHNHDITIVTPVFHRGRAVAVFANCCHVADIGGRGLGAEAHDVYEEGLYIPYLKLYEEGRPNDTLMKILRGNVRTPEQLMGDIHAMVAANDIGGRRLREMMEELGLEDIEGLSAEILTRTEVAMREAIRQIPDGVYENEVTVDGFDQPLTIRCRITVAGDELDVDFSGTSDEVRWGINVPLNYTTAYTTYAVKTVVGPDIPNNEGSFRPVTVRAPEGSLLNPVYPAPVSSRSVYGHLAAMAVISAFAHALPERVMAEGSVVLFNLVFRGYDRQGKMFSVNFLNAGGTGARPAADGLSATAFPSGIRGTPVEIVEATSPLYIKEKELWPDSAGPGRYRGGLGQVIRLTVRTDKPWHFPARYDRVHHPAKGLFGGGCGARTVIKSSLSGELHAKRHHVLQPGEELMVYMPGGGGYGPAWERDPEAVLRDVIAGYVSVERAAEDYGVKVDPETGSIDTSLRDNRRG